MGQLTAPGSALVDPQTGRAAMVGTPQQVNTAFGQRASQDNLPFPGKPQPPTGPIPGTPNLQDAASAGATPGAGNALSPGLTKAGKLLTLLQSGLQGALAGRAASEKAVIQSGGRRSGGAGIGFEAGYELPWQHAQMGQQLQQQQAQTALTRAQAEMVPTPYGPMPAGIAKFILPAQIRAGAQETVQGMKGATAEDIQGQRGQAALGVSQQNTRFKVVPGVGLIDTQTQQPVPGTQGLTVTPEMQQEYGLPPESIGRPISQMTPFASLQRAQNTNQTPVMTAEGLVDVNRRQSTATPVTGPGGQGFSPPAIAAINASPLQVGDVNNPGQTITMPAGKAMAQGAPGTQSASVDVPRRAQEQEVPTNIGNQKVAFNTMIAHADLLQQTLAALNNGTWRTNNALRNAFRKEFGSADVTNPSIIADAYNHEVSNVIAKGHITDKEIGQQNENLDVKKASPAQIQGALNTYRALAQSKMNMLNQQEQSAVNASQRGVGRTTAPPANRPPLSSFER